MPYWKELIDQMQNLRQPLEDYQRFSDLYSELVSVKSTASLFEQLGLLNQKDHVVNTIQHSRAIDVIRENIVQQEDMRRLVVGESLKNRSLPHALSSPVQEIMRDQQLLRKAMQDIRVSLQSLEPQVKDIFVDIRSYYQESIPHIVSVGGSIYRPFKEVAYSWKTLLHSFEQEITQKHVAPLSKNLHSAFDSFQLSLLLGAHHYGASERDIELAFTNSSRDFAMFQDSFTDIDVLDLPVISEDELDSYPHAEKLRPVVKQAFINTAILSMFCVVCLSLNKLDIAVGILAMIFTIFYSLQEKYFLDRDDEE